MQLEKYLYGVSTLYQMEKVWRRNNEDEMQSLS